MLLENVVDPQLRCLLGVRCVERSRLATCLQHASDWTKLVCDNVPFCVRVDLCAPSRRQALAAIALGNVIIAVVMVLNGTIGARLHVGFPVLTRSSFGFWFSYFSVVSRMVLSMFWLGIQAYTGSQCVYQASRRLSLSMRTHGATLTFTRC